MMLTNINVMHSIQAQGEAHLMKHLFTILYACIEYQGCCNSSYNDYAESIHVLFLNKQVNTNGVISFRISFLDFIPSPFPLNTADVLIAPFWDDFDVGQGGDILFRQTNDESLLEAVGTRIEEGLMWDFSPTLLFIATWDGVPGFAMPITVRSYVP